MDRSDEKDVRAAFEQAVTMSPSESRAVGMMHEGERESVGCVNRHAAEGGPKDDREHSRWRSSLMSWGHDPLKR